MTTVKSLLMIIVITKLVHANLLRNFFVLPKLTFTLNLINGLLGSIIGMLLGSIIGKSWTREVLCEKVSSRNLSIEVRQFSMKRFELGVFRLGNIFKQAIDGPSCDIVKWLTPLSLSNMSREPTGGKNAVKVTLFLGWS